MIYAYLPIYKRMPKFKGRKKEEKIKKKTPVLLARSFCVFQKILFL